MVSWQGAYQKAMLPEMPVLCQRCEYSAYIHHEGFKLGYQAKEDEVNQRFQEGFKLGYQVKEQEVKQEQKEKEENDKALKDKKKKKKKAKDLEGTGSKEERLKAKKAKKEKYATKKDIEPLMAMLNAHLDGAVDIS